MKSYTADLTIPGLSLSNMAWRCFTSTADGHRRCCSSRSPSPTELTWFNRSRRSTSLRPELDVGEGAVRAERLVTATTCNDTAFWISNLTTAPPIFVLASADPIETTTITGRLASAAR